MTWEETIKYIRTKPEYKHLVESAYFEEYLPLNVERFRAGDEYKETLALIKKYSNGGSKLLDVGSGNGISAVAFALSEYDVMAIEPDSSDTIGVGAIKKLKEHYRLNNLDVKEAFAEELNLASQSFDIVYARQCMHHAYDLKKFIAELSRTLKKGGILVTVRDHVVFGEKDKQWFLENHPLQKFYGGENAFSPEEYKQAMQMAGLDIKIELKYYDTLINYFPFSEKEIQELPTVMETRLKASLRKKIGKLSEIPFLFRLYKLKVGFTSGKLPDEKSVPGRMYSYIAQKL
jgi:ubiquinone/menaquinone biosynthesis C-methylase UbiE